MCFRLLFGLLFLGLISATSIQAENIEENQREGGATSIDKKTPEEIHKMLENIHYNNIIFSD